MARRLTDEEARLRAHSSGFSPDTDIPYPGTAQPWKGTCDTCHKEISPRLNSVREKGRGFCIHCSGKAKLSEAKAIDRAQEWGFTPTEPYPGLNAPWHGTCNACGEKISARLNHARRGGTPCRACSYVNRAEKNRAANPRELAIAWGYTPSPGAIYVNQATPYPGRCDTCGEEVQPALGNRHHQGPCGHCVGSIKLTQEQAWERAQYNGFTPVEDFTNTHTHWRGVCNTCGDEVQPSLNQLLREGRGACARCGLLGRAEKLRISEAAAIARAVEWGFTPTVPYPGVHHPWQGVCNTCGGEVEPRLNADRGQGPCEPCGFVARSHSLRLSESDAISRALEWGYTPAGPYPGTHGVWPGTCNRCGRVVTPKLMWRESQQSPCASCAEGGGYDPGKPGYLYLMIRPGEQQVGISNVPDKRLATHRSGGWQLLELIGPMSGRRAWEIESEIKQWLRGNGYRLKGTHENWSTASFEIDSLHELISLVTQSSRGVAHETAFVPLEYLDPR